MRDNSTKLCGWCYGHGDEKGCANCGKKRSEKDEREKPDTSGSKVKP